MRCGRALSKVWRRCATPFRVLTLGTHVLKIIFDQVDPDLIKWTDRTKIDQIGA
jgi:hypothetical protein